MGLKDIFLRKSKWKKSDETIGIVFAIDDLEDQTFYGKSAYEIIYENLNPSRMGFFQMYDGDTRNTLDGYENYYCIRIDAKPNVIAYVKDTFENATDKGLAPLENRFIYGKDLKKEPLVYAAYVVNPFIPDRIVGIVHTPGGPPKLGIKKYGHKWILYYEEDRMEFLNATNINDK